MRTDVVVIGAGQAGLAFAPAAPTRPAAEVVPGYFADYEREFDLDVLRPVHVTAVRDGTLLRASEVLLAVEFFSPGSTRIDTVVKHHEYADAGIGRSWMIDLHDGPSLVACHLAGEFGYRNAEPRRGVVAITEPFAVQVDLDALL